MFFPFISHFFIDFLGSASSYSCAAFPCYTFILSVLSILAPNQGTGAYGNSMVGTSTYVPHSLVDNTAHLYLCGSHDYHSKSLITCTN